VESIDFKITFLDGPSPHTYCCVLGGENRCLGVVKLTCFQGLFGTIQTFFSLLGYFKSTNILSQDQARQKIFKTGSSFWTI
jgi:hypothetical protein